MGHADYFKLRRWNAICDRCGFKFKNNELMLEWTGLRVCKDCWDPYPPQLRVRAKIDKQTVPWSRPDTETKNKTQSEVNDAYTYTGSTSTVNPDLTIGTVTASTVDLSWTAATPIPGATITVYKVKKYIGSHGNIIIDVTEVDSSTLSYTDTGLDASTVYHYWIEAIDSNGTPIKSFIKKATTSAN